MRAKSLRNSTVGMSRRSGRYLVATAGYSRSGSSSASSDGSDSDSSNYRSIGCIGAEVTCSRTASSACSSESSYSSGCSKLSRLRPTPTSQSMPIRRSQQSHKDFQYSRGRRINCNVAISPLASQSELDVSQDATREEEEEESVGYDSIRTVRDANTSNRQQSTRRRSRRRESASPHPVPYWGDQAATGLGEPRRRRTAESVSPSDRWNENFSNHSEIYCSGQLQMPRQRQTRRASKQQEQKLCYFPAMYQPNDRIYTGNHADSNVLFSRRKLESLRQLKSHRRRSCDFGSRLRCRDADRRASSFYDDDEAECGDASESLSISGQEDRPLQSCRPFTLQKRDRRTGVGRARESANWPLSERHDRLGKSCHARREVMSHRETLFRCPCMSLSLQTKIYKCDKCAADQVYSKLNGCQSRMPYRDQL